MPISSFEDRPAEEVERLVCAIGDELLGAPHVIEMVAALGGTPRAFERFLIARGSNVAAAAKMFRETTAFRLKWCYGRAVATDEDIRLVAPYWPGVYCTPGGECSNPLVYFQLGEVNPRKIMAEIEEEQFTRYFVNWMETSLRWQAACNERGAPTSRWRGLIEVHDLKGLSFSQLYVPGLRALARNIKLGQDNYPENLAKLVFINTPFFFYYGYRIVSRAMHPHTRAKVEFHADGGAERLCELLGSEQAVERMLASEGRVGASSDEHARSMGRDWPGSWAAWAASEPAASDPAAARRPPPLASDWARRGVHPARVTCPNFCLLCQLPSFV